MSEPKQEEARPNIISQIGSFLAGIFALDNINYKQSIEDIKSDVSFKGFNIWILICSILVASLGLNMNSTAVVIGAMLISPLMGPIVGLGLGIGIFDKRLIYKALKNIGVATTISIITAYLFFKLTPTEEVPELLARTKPTILDLFVAFFGGVAGILAAAKCTKTNVVPGVAIATALMPPLCTAGFGLAIGNIDYFLGAFYLFIMNSIMISVAALMVVLYLRYPKFAFLDDSKKRNVRAGIFLVVLVVSVPSIIFYSNLLQENLQEERINNYIKNEVEGTPGVYITISKVVPNDTGITLVLSASGKYLEKNEIDSLEKKMTDYSLANATIRVIQSQPIGFKEQRLATLKNDIISELYVNSAKKLENKDDEIEMLKIEVQKLSGAKLVSQRLTKLAKSQYNIDQMAVDILVYTNGVTKDTIPTALVKWSKELKTDEKLEQAEKLRSLIKIELITEKVKVIEMD